jgi:hypothetical protein
VSDPFEQSSRRVRERLAPIVDRVVVRHRGERGFLHFRDTASMPPEGLSSWFEDVLDGALAGGLRVEGDRATLQTRSGAIPLAG